MTKTKLPNGIQNIALSFSGGGFRAATYCLGCASYLHQLPYDGGTMLNKVRFISSASGGSITALTLFSMLRAGKDFEAIYQHLLDNISSDKLIKHVFEILETDRYWLDRPDKMRNLINAFTIAYDEDLFEHATYQSLFDLPANGKPFIDELSVNTTEFNNGQNFRFGTRGTIGNKYLSLAKNGKNEDEHTPIPLKNMSIIKKIRLGDVLACSSCFPGGFEPVLFPRDFSWKTKNDALTWQQLGATLNYKSHYSNQPVDLNVKEEMASFMDGGIDDNQGIYSFIKANERSAKGYDYDLYMTCDVSSNYLEHPFTYPKPLIAPVLNDTIPTWKKRFNCWKLLAIIAILGFFIAGILVSCFTALKYLSVLLYGFAAGLALAGLAIYLISTHYIGKIKAAFDNETAQDARPNTWKMIWDKYSNHLLRLPINQLFNMAEARLSSVLLLADSVYLKKIRRMSYDYLYSQDKKDHNIDDSGELPSNQTAEKAVESNQSWDNNIAMTAIYLLSTKNDWMLQQELKREPWDEKTTTVAVNGNNMLLIDVLQPGSLLRKPIDQATAVETTLWFDDYHIGDQAKESLLVAGQATMCYNLLRIVHRIESQHPEWEALKAKLLIDWVNFKTDPEFQIRNTN